MTPVVVEAEVDIRRSPEDVFDYCSDPSHEPEWNPMMKRIVKVTDGPVRVGTRYTTEFVKGPAMVMECIRYERPTSWSMKGDSRALKAGGGGRVVPTSDGAHLVMRMELEPHGLLKLAAPLLRRRMTPMFRRDLDNIKARLEPAERAGHRNAAADVAAVRLDPESDRWAVPTPDLLSREMVSDAGTTTRPAGTRQVSVDPGGIAYEHWANPATMQTRCSVCGRRVRRAGFSVRLSVATCRHSYPRLSRKASTLSLGV